MDWYKPAYWREMNIGRGPMSSIFAGRPQFASMMGAQVGDDMPPFSAPPSAPTKNLDYAQGVQGTEPHDQPVDWKKFLEAAYGFAQMPGNVGQGEHAQMGFAPLMAPTYPGDIASLMASSPSYLHPPRRSLFGR